jgi:signal transduction histidine kinase
MSQQSHRSAVPPRELAATITARAVLRAGWAVAAVYLGISVVVLADLYLARGYPPSVLAAVLAVLAQGSVLVALARRPNWRRGLVYLAVGTVVVVIYDLCLLLADPALNDHGTYLLNRPAVVLLLIGAVSRRLVHGVYWCGAGYLLGTAATVAVQFGLGLDILPGYGPLVSLVVYLAIIIMFSAILKSQRRFAPNFSAVEVETARMAGQRELEAHAIAVLHDTVLNDLAAVANGRDTIDERARARYLRDIAAVSTARLGLSAAPREAPVVPSGDVREELLAVISEYQWRGLTVDVSGGEALSTSLAPDISEALLGAVGGCLENVMRHSGSDYAEVFLDASETSLSIMIVDHGRGFDPEAIPANRLGIRRGLVQRIESSGGSVRIWSAIGAGTSVVIAVPIGASDD